MVVGLPDAGGWLSGHRGWGEEGGDAGHDLSEPFDVFSSEFICQFPLDRRDGLTHSPQRRMAAFGQVNACEAPVLGVVVTSEVSEGLKLTEVMVERCLENPEFAAISTGRRPSGPG